MDKIKSNAYSENLGSRIDGPGTNGETNKKEIELFSSKLDEFIAAHRDNRNSSVNIANLSDVQRALRSAIRHPSSILDLSSLSRGALALVPLELMCSFASMCNHSECPVAMIKFPRNCGTFPNWVAEFDQLKNIEMPSFQGPGARLDLTPFAKHFPALKLDLSDANLQNADFSGLDLSGICLSSANLSGANLTNAKLREAKLDGADFRNAKLIGVDLTLATLNNAKLIGADLSNTNFSSANASNADFSSANLYKSSFTEAILCDAKVNNADLTKSSFPKAILFGVDFTTARNFSKASIIKCLIDARTKLPHGKGDTYIEPDDLVRNDSILFFADKTLFTENMLKLGIKIGVEIVPVTYGVSGGNRWLRDLFFRGVTNQGQEQAVKMYRIKSEDEVDIQFAVGSTLKNNHKDSYLNCPADGADPFIYGDNEIVFDGNPMTAENPPLTYGASVISAVDVHSGAFVPAGNLFVVKRSPEEETQCFVGYDALMYGPSDKQFRVKNDIDELHISERYKKIKNRALRLKLQQGKTAYKKELSEALGVKKITTLAQIFYHVDLQMLYLGAGCFAVHSFVESVNFLKEHAIDMRKQLGKLYDPLLELNNKYAANIEKNFVDLNVTRLQKRGMKVVKCCGLLFTKGILDGRPQGLVSSFMNGIPFNISGDRYVVVPDAPGCDAHKKYISEICLKAGVKAEFVNTSGTKIDAVKYQEQNHGAVRCLSMSGLYASYTKQPEYDSQDEEDDVIDSNSHTTMPRNSNLSANSTSTSTIATTVTTTNTTATTMTTTTTRGSDT